MGKLEWSGGTKRSQSARTFLLIAPTEQLFLLAGVFTRPLQDEWSRRIDAFFSAGSRGGGGGVAGTATLVPRVWSPALVPAEVGKDVEGSEEIM